MVLNPCLDLPLILFFSSVLQTEKAFLKQPKVFLWYVTYLQERITFFFFHIVDLMLNIYLIFFLARRNLERERDLGKVEIAFGNPLDSDLRLPEMPSKVSSFLFPYHLSRFFIASHHVCSVRCKSIGYRLLS